MNTKLKILLSLSLIFFSLTIFGQDIKQDLVNNKRLFTGELYSSLSSKANAKTIHKVQSPMIRKALQEMLNGDYAFEYRVQNYKNYLSPFTLSKELKTGTYSQFENPTGIFFTKGEEVALIVGNYSDSVKIRITDFGKEGGDSTYKLERGINIITPTNSGNGYITYFSDNRSAKIEDVKIHILGGKVNGYFDVTKHSNEDWKNLLDNEGSTVLDIMGERVQLIYSKESLKNFSPNNGVELIATYDSIMTIQHDIMGLNKYNRVPKNHILGRVIWQGYMHADDLGAAFHDETMQWVADVKKLKSEPWAVAHEFGHVNQVRPWMRWTGTAEVTNNIFSSWTKYLFNPTDPMLEKEKKKDYDGEIIGGRITSYMESAFIKKYQWLTQPGPDRWDRKNKRDWGGDHFVKLVPLWQLQLYYAVAGKGNDWYKPDFYANIYIKAIDNEREPKDAAEAQLNFIKQACDAAQTDLTDFFEISGMLSPIDLWVDDYTCSQMTITDKDITEVKRYASKYKKATTPVMHYITANSVNYYKNKLPIKGELNKGITKGENTLTINHSIWQNVVAFETYKGDQIIKIAFGGAGSHENTSTLVRFPEGSTRVEAVAWDGTRKTVYKL